MSDEAPETADKAIRGYLGAIAFTLVLVGGELMVEKDGARLWIGVALVLLALPVYLSAVWWRLLKPKLNVQALASINVAVARAPWWLRAVFIFGLALVLSQFVGRLPFLSREPIMLSKRLWPPLTNEEEFSLERMLKANPKRGPIRIICMSSDCRELAGNLISAFQAAEWRPFAAFSGFPTEPVGITLYLKDINDHTLADAIEKSTSLKVVHIEPTSDPNLESLFIGIRP